MAHRTASPEQLATLESIMDSIGLDGTLEALSDICGEKSEHVLSNWQDKPLAGRWAQAARRLATESKRATEGRL